MEKGVRLPTKNNGGYKILGGVHYGIFNNLPAPINYDIGGHACMKIDDIITQHFADGQGFEFSESTTRLFAQASDCIHRVLDPGEKSLKDEGIYDFIEYYGVKHYFILLQFIDEGKVEGNMAVVYDNWDVGDTNFKTVLPYLCEILFGYNVLS